VTNSTEPIVVGKNRKRALWALVIVVFFIPISAWFVFLGAQPGRPDVSWAMILFGLLGLFAFTGSAIRIVLTMRSHWRLELTPEQLVLYAPTYTLPIHWDQIVGIAVDKVQKKPECVLVFENLQAVVQKATFQGKSKRHDAVTDAATMEARLEENYECCSYHLVIPGKILEAGPDELAALLARGRNGELWQEGEA
jgi:hypothetical protein